MDKFLYGSLLCAVLFCPVLTFADNDAKVEAANEVSVALSEEFVDPAFDQYVNINLLGTAWKDQDAAALTDVALQLAQGEKILLRNHKAFPAKVVFDKALAVAVDQNDTATLERLGKAAQACGCDEFAKKVADAGQLAGATRSAKPDEILLKAPEDGDADPYIAETVDLIKRLRVANDKEYLESLEKEITDYDGVSKDVKDALLKFCKTNAANVGDASPDDLKIAADLEKLVGESRAPRRERDLFVAARGKLVFLTKNPHSSTKYRNARPGNHPRAPWYPDGPLKRWDYREMGPPDQARPMPNPPGRHGGGKPSFHHHHHHHHNNNNHNSNDSRNNVEPQKRKVRYTTGRGYI